MSSDDGAAKTVEEASAGAGVGAGADNSGAASESAVPPASELAKGGFVFTWGKGASGELGHNEIILEQLCPFPTVVPGLRNVKQVACGNNCSAAVTVNGELYTWGSARGGRLGHGTDASFDAPEPVRFFADARLRVHQVSMGESHCGCVVRGADPSVYTWGKGGHGCLGAAPSPGLPQSQVPVPVLSPKAPRRRRPSAASRPDGAADGPADGKADDSGEAKDDGDKGSAHLLGASVIRCGYNTTAVVTEDGALYTWGAGGERCLGHGDQKDRFLPTRVAGIEGAVVDVALGSLCAGAVTDAGEAWMWGYGAYGNLGVGDRKSRSSPVRVGGALAGQHVVQLHCTVGQINVSKPRDAKECTGKEGPHTLAVTRDGGVYAWGTCHKGMLGNVRDKILVYDGDELTPYRIGDNFRDHPTDGPSSGYLEGCRGVMGIASSIHSAVLDDAGNVYTFGCASDGRMGIQKYMTGLQGGRSKLKCYVSKPTAIEYFRDNGVHVTHIDASRRHMIAVGVFRDGRGPRGRRSSSTATASARKGSRRRSRAGSGSSEGKGGEASTS